MTDEPGQSRSDIVQGRILAGVLLIILLAAGYVVLFAIVTLASR